MLNRVFAFTSESVLSIAHNDEANAYIANPPKKNWYFPVLIEATPLCGTEERTNISADTINKTYFPHEYVSKTKKHTKRKTVRHHIIRCVAFSTDIMFNF
jgi:hypothetical protein